MKVNTIILIDDKLKVKQFFIEKLNEEIKFSYTKLEGLFQSLMETFPEEYGNEKKENLYQFLIKFLKNLNKKEQISLIDVNRLSIENAKALVNQNENVLAIYFDKVENHDRIFSIDIKQEQELDEVIQEIKKRIF